MIRIIRVTSLGLLAAIAFSALAVAGASAGQFHAEKAPVKLTGTQTTQHKFTVNAGTTTCTTATFEGTSSNATEPDVTMTPVYSGCTFIGVSTPIDVNGCKYTFTSAGNGTVQTEVAGSVHILGCTNAAKNIVVTGPGCTVTVGEQTLGGIKYHNTGAGTTREVDAIANVTGIKYTQSGVFCTNGTFTNGTYTGTTRVTGEEDPGSGHIGIWVS